MPIKKPEPAFLPRQHSMPSIPGYCSLSGLSAMLLRVNQNLEGDAVLALEGGTYTEREEELFRKGMACGYLGVSAWLNSFEDTQKNQFKEVEDAEEKD